MKAREACTQALELLNANGLGPGPYVEEDLRAAVNFARHHLTRKFPTYRPNRMENVVMDGNRDNVLVIPFGRFIHVMHVDPTTSVNLTMSISTTLSPSLNHLSTDGKSLVATLDPKTQDAY